MSVMRFTGGPWDGKEDESQKRLPGFPAPSRVSGDTWDGEYVRTEVTAELVHVYEFRPYYSGEEGT